MTEPGPIELIEEATRLFRTAGLATLSFYYIGSLPFVLGFLFFWADMSHNAVAYQSVLPESFAVAVLYLWMKVWQAIYAAELRNRLGRHSGQRWTALRVLRVAMQQSAVQPTGLVLIPAGALLVLPFAWIYGFYQNFTVLAGSEGAGPGDAIRQSRAYARLWIRQSWIMLSIQVVFTIFVSVNIAIALFIAPRLLHMLLGIDTALNRSGANLLNSTFAAVCLGLTYLCIDPLMKSIYVLRCFYAESIHSGADLRRTGQDLFEQAKRYSALLLVLLTLPIASAQPRGPITAPELDRAIDGVIHQRQYTWRLPRQNAPMAESKNPFVRFTESAMAAIRRGYRQFMAWLRELFRRPESETGPGGIGSLRMGVYFLGAAFAAALVVLLIRGWRRTPPTAQAAPAPARVIDLSSENLVADQLPEDGWRGLANEWIARNDFRMAIRALYLASLAYLGAQDLIRIHRGKSNWDYQKELDRRARARPELAAVFGRNLAAFESSWYGRTEVGPDAIEAFAANLDRIKSCVE